MNSRVSGEHAPVPVPPSCLMGRTLAVGPVFVIALTILLAGCDIRPSNIPATPPAPLATDPAGPIALPLRPPGWEDIASKTYPLPLSTELAEEILLTTSVFNFHNSPGASHHAYLTLIDLANGVSRMQTIARDGRGAGQLYALCALWDRAPAQAEALASTLAAGSTEVVVLDNDIRTVRRVSEVVAMIRSTRLWEWFRNPTTLMRHDSGR